MYRKISKEEKMLREKINEAKNILYSRIYSGESPNVELEIDFLNDDTKMEPGYYMLPSTIKITDAQWLCGSMKNRCYRLPTQRNMM